MFDHSFVCKAFSLTFS